MSKLKSLYQDIFHIYYSDLIASFPDSAKEKIYGTTFLKKVKNVLESSYKSIASFFIYYFKSKKSEHEIVGKNWLFIVGTNNYNTISFLKTEIENTVFVSPYRYEKKDEKIYLLLHPFRFFYLIKRLPLFFQLYFGKEKSIQRFWDTGFRGIGLYEAYVDLLKKYKPKNIIFANDHTVEPRAMLLAAKHLSIPSFYIQHACMRDDFPALKFDHSLLEGQFAVDTYSKCGEIDGAIKLIGIPRMDNYLGDKNQSSKVTKIGICSNLLDSTETIQKIIDQLKSSFPTLTISYRPHPSDKRKLDLNGSNILISNSNQETAMEFLKSQDLIIAGNTSIHYEAVMLNVISIYFKLSDDFAADDLYGFCKNGLSLKANSIDDLKAILNPFLNRKPDVLDKAKYYNSVLGSKEEGKSKEIASTYIRNQINQTNY